MQPRDKALLGELGDVDLRLLRVFKAVADCGGMAAAELELNITLSTISRHLKDLETRLDLVLCRRGRAGFSLTPEGEQVYDAAERLLQATDAFRLGLHDIHQQLGGTLHVALFEKIASNPRARVSDALRRFRQQAPAVALHVHIGTITMIERGVLDGRYHLGVLPEHRPSESLSYQALFDEDMRLYAAQGHPWFVSAATPRQWPDLRQQQLVGLGYHSPNMELARAHGLRRDASASDQEGVLLLVLSGAFLGFLPDHYAAPLVADGRMRAVSPDTLRYRCQFSSIQRLDPAPLRIAQAFQACLVAAHGPAAAPA